MPDHGGMNLSHWNDIEEQGDWHRPPKQAVNPLRWKLAVDLFTATVEGTQHWVVPYNRGVFPPNSKINLLPRLYTESLKAQERFPEIAEEHKKLQPALDRLMDVYEMWCDALQKNSDEISEEDKRHLLNEAEILRPFLYDVLEFHKAVRSAIKNDLKIAKRKFREKRKEINDTLRTRSPKKLAALLNDASLQNHPALGRAAKGQKGKVVLLQLERARRDLLCWKQNNDDKHVMPVPAMNAAIAKIAKLSGRLYRQTQTTEAILQLFRTLRIIWPYRRQETALEQPAEAKVLPFAPAWQRHWKAKQAATLAR
jgi:hypothetical protein